MKKKNSETKDQSDNRSEIIKKFNEQSPVASKDGKIMRKVNPLGMRVLVKLRKENNQSDGGLYLPEGSKQALQESLLGEVTEVAKAVDEDTHEEANVSGIPLRAKVLIPKHAGVKVPWDDMLRIVETKEILAIVDEISVL